MAPAPRRRLLRVRPLAHAHRAAPGGAVPPADALLHGLGLGILGAVVAIGTLISALVNLILWVDDPNGYDSAMQNYETDPMGLATAERSLINATDEEIINGTRAYAEMSVPPPAMAPIASLALFWSSWSSAAVLGL